jgi:iron complex transport system ATP-binding protein
VSFRADNLAFEYGLSGATFELPRAGFVAIAGPNGAGKSTLAGVLAALRHPYRGSCVYDGREVRDWPRRDFARRVGFLPQTLHLEFPFTVEQVVFMGRTPHAEGWFDSPEDRSAVDRALEITDTTAFAARDFRSLSGGERQRVILASALAQEPETLVLDEPATFLDLKHQLSIYRLLSGFARGGKLVVAVTHDLNLALTFADRILVLDQGRVAAQGPPREVLTPEMIARVFSVQASIHPGPHGAPHIFFGANS